MTLTWPWALLGLLLVPVVVTGYRRLLRRQEERRGELAAKAWWSPSPERTGGHGSPQPCSWPLSSCSSWHDEPVAAVAEPRREGTVVLAFDVSNEHVGQGHQAHPARGGQGGGSAVHRQAAAVRQARRRRLRRHRARHGAPDDGQVSRAGGGRPARRHRARRRSVVACSEPSVPSPGGPSPRSPTSESGSNEESDIGYYGGTAIVLLSDGENTTGPDPRDVAELASAAGVRI